MKARILLIAIIVIACIGCKQGNQPEYVFEKITLSNEDKAALDQIFSEYNNEISNYALPLMRHGDCEKCKAGQHKDYTERSNEHAIVEVIGSQKELSAICPKGVRLPKLDSTSPFEKSRFSFFLHQKNLHLPNDLQVYLLVQQLFSFLPSMQENLLLT